LNEGWIKIHRKIRDHWIYENPEYFRAWVTMLMEVNHSDNKVLIHGEIINCKRGESVHSLKSWAKLFGKKWSIQKVRTFFELLKNDFMIETKGLSKTTRLSILNYNTYQVSSTNKQQTNNKQITTNKNEKNDKNEKNIYNIENFDAEISHLFDFFISTLNENELKIYSPKTSKDKYEWFDTLDKCYRIDNYEYWQIKDVIEHFRNDEFWKDNFYSAKKLRTKNKYGVKYIDFFYNKIKDDLEPPHAQETTV